MARVLVFHPTQSAEYEALVRSNAAEHGLEVVAVAEPEDVADALPSTDILLASNSFPMNTLGGASSLRWVHVQGAGVDRWMSSALPHDVRVTRTVGTFGPRMAEYAMAHILSVYQTVHAYRHQQGRHQWRAHDAVPLSGRVLGIAGLGSIGTALADRAHAFGMRVVGLARTPRTDGPYRVFGQDDLLSFLAELDVVVNIVPLTPATRHLFGAAAFEAMKPDAWFLNMGRGSTVDEPALVRALQTRAIAGAILDVFEEEPLPASSPLWAMDNVVVTPHIAGSSIPEEVVASFMANVPLYAADRPMLDEVERTRAY